MVWCMENSMDILDLPLCHKLFRHIKSNCEKNVIESFETSSNLDLHGIILCEFHLVHLSKNFKTLAWGMYSNSLDNLLYELVWNPMNDSIVLKFNPHHKPFFHIKSKFEKGVIGVSWTSINVHPYGLLDDGFLRLS